MEDDLKILKVEYLSNHLLDHTQILNLSWYEQTIFYKSFKWRRPPNLKILSLSFYDQTIFCKSFKWRRPPMEDDLKILKVDYLSNCLLDHTKISNLSLYDQTIFCKSFKWRRPQNIKSGMSHKPSIGSYSWPNFIVQIQNIKSGISRQPLIGSYSNFELKLIWQKYIL